MFFGKNKKKKEEEDQLIESLTAADQPQHNQPNAQSKGKTEARLETLDAQINALKELLQAQQERFERHSEEIGELRSTLADREKQIHELETKAVRASDLVSQVQPETFMSEQKKAEAKIEAIHAKLDNNEIISNNIIDELKKVKNTASAFRGTDHIIKLNKDVHGELISIKKVEATVEKHADRVEAMYVNMSSNVELFEKIKDDIEGNNELCGVLKKDIQKNSVAIKGIPRKEELYHLKGEMSSIIENIEKDKSVYSKRNLSLEASVNHAAKTIELFEKKMEHISKGISELSQASQHMQSQIESDQKMLQHQVLLDKNMKAHSVDITENRYKIDSILEVVEKMARMSAKR